MPISKVMCAFNRKAKLRHEKYPAFVQPKLDGLRMTWEDGQLWSRDRKPWRYDVVPHIYEALQGVTASLDGELYVHGWRLQTINSVGGVMRVETHGQYAALEYHVFDIIHKAPFEKRAELMQKEIPKIGGPVKLVQTVYCQHVHQCGDLFRKYRKAGYEGAMIRDPHAPYGFPEYCTNKENRWTSLLKYKEWMDLDATIIGFNEGEGAFRESLGSLRLMTKGGAVFDAGTGLSHGDRSYIWANREFFLGKSTRVQYETLSAAGRPLKPVITFVEELEV